MYNRIAIENWSSEEKVIVLGLYCERCKKEGTLFNYQLFRIMSRRALVIDRGDIAQVEVRVFLKGQLPTNFVLSCNESASVPIVMKYPKWTMMNSDGTLIINNSTVEHGFVLT